MDSPTESSGCVRHKSFLSQAPKNKVLHVPITVREYGCRIVSALAVRTLAKTINSGFFRELFLARCSSYHRTATCALSPKNIASLADAILLSLLAHHTASSCGGRRRRELRHGRRPATLPNISRKGRDRHRGLARHRGRNRQGARSPRGQGAIGVKGNELFADLAELGGHHILVIGFGERHR